MKRIISLILSFALFVSIANFSATTSVSAEDSTTFEIDYNGETCVLKIEETDTYIKTTISSESGVVYEESILNLKTNKIDTVKDGNRETINLQDIVQDMPIDDQEDPVDGASNPVEQDATLELASGILEFPGYPNKEPGILALKSEPRTNSGLKKSSVYSKYFSLGSMNHRLYKGTAKLHRIYSVKDAGSAKRFTVSSRTVFSTLVNAIFAAFSKDIIGVVKVIANFLINNAYDYAVSVPVKIKNYHYTYKVTINSQTSYKYKYCREYAYWYTKAPNGKEKFEKKGTVHSYISNFNACQNSLQINSTNGKPVNISCSKSAA